MYYGSIDGVKDNLPKLRKYIIDDANSTSDLDIKHSTVERILTQVTGQINTALSPRYYVPFASDNIPAVVTQITNDLAAFRIARSYMTTVSAEENHNLMAMRKDAKEILMSLVSGEYELIDAEKKYDQQNIEQLLDDEPEEIFDMEDESTWQAKL
jgi:phage gp36-like protein